MQAPRKPPSEPPVTPRSSSGAEDIVSLVVPAYAVVVLYAVAVYLIWKQIVIPGLRGLADCTPKGFRWLRGLGFAAVGPACVVLGGFVSCIAYHESAWY